MKLIPRRLGPKLNLFLLVVLLALRTATAALMFFGFRRTQDDATEQSRQGLEKQGSARLGELALQTAGFGNLILSQATDAGAHASDYLGAFPEAGGSVAWTPSRMVADGFGGYVDFTPGRTSDAWLDPGGTIDLAAVRDLQESAALDPLFPSLIARSPDAVAVYYLAESGATRYYPQRGYAARATLALTTPQQEAIAAAAPDQNPGRAPVWSDPYPDPTANAMLITAYTPVYAGDEYRGVIGVDLAIDRLVAQADAVEVSPTGFAFVIDRNGEVLEGDAYDTVVAAQADDSNAAFESILRDMQAGNANVERATLGGGDVLVAYAPVGGVGASLAVVAPIDEVTAESAAVGSEIRGEGNRTIAFTLGTMVLLFAFALVAFAWMNRRMLLRPIEALVRGTQSVATGDLSKRIPVMSNDELGSLADSFNSMTLELEMSRTRVVAQREQIRESEAQFRALFNAMTDAVIVNDRNGRYLRAAPTRHSDALGPLNAAIGLTLHDVMPREQADRLLTQLRLAIDTGEVREFEQRIELPDGGERWINATISRLSSETALVVARDVTSRKIAEQALAEREEQYRSVFEEANDGLFITSLAGALVDVNPAAWKMHGYERDEFMRLSPPEFIHPDDHHIFDSYVSEVVAGRRYTARARDIRKDGSVFYVEVVGAPILYGGQPHILGVVRDITERVLQERLLEQRVEDQTRELASLLEVTRAVSSTLELKRLARLILAELVKVADYTGATLAAVQDGNLIILDSYGPFAEEVLSGPTSSVPVALLGTDFWSSLRRGEVMMIDDVEADTAPARAYRETFSARLDMPSFKAIRSWLAMPLMHQDQFVGVFTASHVEPYHFTAETARLVLAAASQAAVAIENARLFEQTRQRTRELTSLLEVSRTVAAELEVQPLLELMLDEVHAVAPFDRAAFLQIDGDEMVVVAARDRRPERAARELGERFRLDTGTRAWLGSHDAEPVVVDDIMGDSRGARAYRRAVGDQISDRFSDIRSWMVVPLRLKDRPIGMLTLARDRPSYYDERHGQLATAIASQAAVALENARLFQQTEERTRELETILRVTGNVGSTLDLDQELTSILDQTRQVAEYRRAAIIIREGDEFRYLHSRIVPDEADSAIGMRMPVHLIPFWAQIEQGEHIRIPDITADTLVAQAFRLAQRPVLEHVGGSDAEDVMRGIRSWLAVPLSSKNGVIGLMSLAHDQVDYYSERRARIVAAIAAQAAVAIENARLFAETTQRTRELAALLRVSNSIASTLKQGPLVAVILEQLRTVIDNNGASILELEGDDLVVMDYQGSDADRARLRFRISQAPEIWERMLEREALIIDDVRAEDRHAIAFRRAAAERLRTTFAHVRSWMAVPMILGDRISGILAVSHGTPGFFTLQHAGLARAIADQAAVAIDNAHLLRETERRASEMTALLGISHTIGSTLELRPLVTVILEQLRSMVPYLGASILELRGDEMAIVDWQQPDIVSTVPPQRPLVFSLGNAPTLVEHIERREPMIVRDIRDDTSVAGQFRATVGDDLMNTLFAPVRSWVAVPLIAKDRPIGLLAMSSGDPDFFTPDRVRAASLVASQAAVALENAHLYEEADARTRELTALLEVSGALASTLELRPLARVVLDQLRHVIDYAGASLLLVEDRALTIVEDRAVEGADDVIGLRIPLSRAADLWERLASRQPIVIRDVRGDDPTARAYRRVLGESFELPALRHVSSWMAVPLVLQDRVIGMMSMSRPEPAYFTERHVRLARAIADQAAVAIENARLYEQAQQLAAVEERQRLARELHDSVSQALYGVALGARTARTLLDRDPAKATEPVEYVLSLAEAGLAEMRALIFELRPESLELEGLVAGLEKQTAALRARHHIDVESELCLEPDAPLPVKEAIARIAQEAMHNTVKHARATHVTVRLRQINGALELEVEDDGRGFDPAQPYAGHLGLRSMRERATRLGGEITVDSAPGKGARVCVSIPVNGSSR